jgi:hypothetical protein
MARNEVHIFGKTRGQVTWIGALLLAALLMSGCVTLNDYEAAQEHHDDIIARLESGHSARQTFFSRRPRLNSIQLWLQPEGAPDPAGRLTIEIYPVGEKAAPLVAQTFTHVEIANRFPLTLSFAPLAAPPGQEFSVEIKTEGGGPMRILGRGEDAYPRGEFWIDQAPTETDLGFRLTYDYDFWALLADLAVALRSCWLVIPALLAAWLPGRVLLLALEASQGKPLPFDWGERSALSVGLSLAFLPLLLLWTPTLGLHWSRVGMWLFILILAEIYLLFLARKSPWLARRNEEIPITSDVIQPTPERVGDHESKAHAMRPYMALMTEEAFDLALLAVFLLTLGVRLIMIRDMATPAWVDSVHHAIITRLILEQGAIPATYEPLVDSVSAAYHPGFHISLAVFTWLSGLPLHTSMLVFGQILNALAIFAVYLFSTTFFKNRLAGIFAALITGLFSPMPAYYTSWGRYTQLAGMLILPACLGLLFYLLPESTIKDSAQPTKTPRGARLAALVIAGISLGGLYLTHYRVAAFLLLLLLAVVLGRNMQNVLLARRGMTMRMLEVFFLAGCLSILFTLPWWPGAFRNLFLPRYGAAGGGAVKLFSDFTWNYLTPALGERALQLAGIGLLLSLLFNWPAALSLTVWVGLLFLTANLSALRLPGGSFINNTSVEIALFMPISALGGAALAWLISLPVRWMPRRAAWLYAIPWTAAALWAALWAARSLLPIINPITILSRQDDLPAMSWIEENIPAGETILINSFNWGYGYHAGEDGGYWITPLAGRKTLPPSVLIGFGGDPVLSRQARLTSRKAAEIAADPAALANFLASQNMRYVYIGARGGQLSAKALLESGLFQEIYHFQSTWVLESIPK